LPWRRQKPECEAALARISFTALAAAGLIAALAPAAGQSPAVDMELLLAVDVSASVDEEEFALQVNGLAAGFRDPDVTRAIARSENGIAVAVMQWAGVADQVVAVGWDRLRSASDAADFADRIARMARRYRTGDTRIGDALQFSVRALETNAFWARRRVIDINSDGGAEKLGLARDARDAAVAAGIVVNGLAIESEVLDLEAFFRDNVIGGEGAFVIRVGAYADFAAAMRRKLIREMTFSPTAGLWPELLTKDFLTGREK